MTLTEILDILEALLKASQHPDIVRVDRYGTAGEPWGPTAEKSRVKGATGLRVTHQSSATSSLWGAVWPGGQPIPVPEVMPPVKYRAARLAILTVQLLDVARPAPFKTWQLLALPKLGPEEEQRAHPSGVGITCADGTAMLLRIQATGATGGFEPTEDPGAGYVVPAGLSA